MPNKSALLKYACAMNELSSEREQDSVAALVHQTGQEVVR
jgi:hypothetical protein